MAARRFVLLDRDGTLNVERHYLSAPDQIELLPGAADGLRALQALGLGLIVVTNQSGIGRGYFDEQRLRCIHDRLRQLLHAEDVELDAIYSCPHHPDAGCCCRKPGTGLIEQAVRDFGFNPAECFVIGDKPCDIEMGYRAGASTLLVCTGYGPDYETEIRRLVEARDDHRHFAVDDLFEAAAVIRRQLTETGPPMTERPAGRNVGREFHERVG